MDFKVKVAVVKTTSGRGKAVKENRVEKTFHVTATDRKSAIARGKELMADSYPDLTPHVLSADAV